jgi:phosphate transport system substrate-binding protein
MKLSRSLKIAALASVAALFSTQAAFAAVTITGTGSSFATPLINACKIAWQDSTGNTVSYYGGGSGAGRANANNAIGDFNFSDASYTPAVSTLLHIPVVAAPVAISYNVTGFNGQLYLSKPTLSKIFSGQITKWNDPAIVAENKGVKASVVYKKDAKGKLIKVKGKPVVLTTTSEVAATTLPDQDIRVVYRSDSSGTTQNLVNFFISEFPSTWTKASSGTFASVFPGDVPLSWLSASGSAGVSALAQRTPYSVTYIESSYANTLGKAAIKNEAGNYQLPTAGGTAAFLGAATASADGKLTFNYKTTDPGAYVLGIASYALVDSSLTTDSAKATTSFLKYLLTDKCTGTNPALEYTTIGGTLLATDNALLAKLAQ